MAQWQTGIVQDDSSHHIFLEFAVRGAPAALPGRALAMASVPDGAQVLAFGAGLSRSLAEVPAPEGIADFTAIEGAEGLSAPATQRDLFIWLQGERRDELFARALAWRDALIEVADLATEEHGFRFRDSRDLTGFVDGSANPKGDTPRLRRPASVKAAKPEAATFWPNAGCITWPPSTPCQSPTKSG